MAIHNVVWFWTPWGLIHGLNAVEEHSGSILTPCCWAMQKCVIAIPCAVDGSHVSTFSYAASCTCVCQLVYLTFRLKVIDSLMQDAWVSIYK